MVVHEWRATPWEEVAKGEAGSGYCPLGTGVLCSLGHKDDSPRAAFRGVALRGRVAWRQKILEPGQHFWKHLLKMPCPGAARGKMERRGQMLLVFPISVFPP